MPIDVAAMRAIAQQLYVTRIAVAHGPAGERALRELLAGIEVVHRHVAYEMVEQIDVLVALVEDDRVLTEADVVEIDARNLAQTVYRTATIQFLPNGRLLFREAPLADPAAIATRAVMYRFERTDLFFLDGQFEAVPNPTGYPSAFGLPTFWELGEALSTYRDRMVRNTSCRILRDCWHDRHQYLLVNKPERIMRRSLENFLESSLRGHDLIEVRPEQNVDETHPVDIKVTWSMSNRLALIEIKWLGQSVNDTATGISTTYEAARAITGAEQLADYLDANREYSPEHLTMGFLVIYDARRRNVTFGIQTLAREDAVYYANRDVEFDASYLERRDTASPFRMFMEPPAA